MNILHYSLGFPPYRTGGLTKYCTDLALDQAQNGHTVGLLWPGEINPLRKRSIRERKPFFQVHSFEMINPLPVALDEGIPHPAAYMEAGDTAVFERFFQRVRPDVFHIHTLMGLPRELVETANKMGIRTVFTTHDYYGICPKVTLFRGNAVCDGDHDCADCAACNATGLSPKKIALMQSPLYRKLKNSSVVKRLRAKHRSAFFEQETAPTAPTPEQVQKASDYRALRDYYRGMLEQMDVIHFNSETTRQVYLRYLTPRSEQVVAITHGDIGKHLTEKHFDGETVRFAYLAPVKAIKVVLGLYSL